MRCTYAGARLPRLTLHNKLDVRHFFSGICSVKPMGAGQVTHSFSQRWCFAFIQQCANVAIL